MARQFNSDEEQTGASTESTEATEQANEASTEATTDEATQTGTESDSADSNEAGSDTASATTEATTAAAPPVDPALLQAAFEQTVAAGLDHEGRDADTGTLPEVALGPIRLAYSNLATRGKTAARDWLQSKMTEAMIQGPADEAQFINARSYLEIMNALKSAAPKPTINKPPVDPTEAFVQRIAALILAPNLVPVPEGVASDWANKAQAKVREVEAEVKAYRDWMHAMAGKPAEEVTEAPKVSEVVLASLAIAKGRASAPKKASTGSTGPKAPRAASTNTSGVKRNIATHIQSAFAELPAGSFLTIGEIVKHVSEEYGSDSPSQGAVAARLFPGGDGSKCNVPGIRAEQRDKKGAVKV